MRRILLAVAATMSPLLAAASEGGEEGWFAPLWHVPTILWQILNFGLVVALFVFLLKGKAPAFFDARAREIKEALQKAVREKEQAISRLKEIESKMGRLQEEVASIEAEALASAQVEKERIALEAEAARERIRREAVEEVERRLQSARGELRAYAAALVEESARELLQREVGEGDEDRLMEEFLDKLEREAHGRRG